MTTGEPKRTLDRTGAILDSAPVVAANFMVAWVFGVAALKAGFPLWLPVAMCMFFYTWASQFSALALLAAQASAPTILLTTLLITRDTR